jgi:DNA-binding CsgD family transcriptional regulator
VDRRGHPPEFRRTVLDLIAAGRPIVDVARDLGISAQSIYTWRRRDPHRQGPRAGAEQRGELRLLALIAQGSTARSVARQFGISERTVQKHLALIHRKLGCRD